MRCYYHPTEEAVAQCCDCQKALCIKCANKYEIPICTNCNTKRINSEIKTHVLYVSICILLFIIGTNIESLGTNKNMGGYILVSIYSGWKFIKRFCSNIFIWFTSIKILLIYYLVRICVSLIIGFFISPIFIIYTLYRIATLIHLKKML